MGAALAAHPATIPSSGTQTSLAAVVFFSSTCLASATSATYEIANVYSTFTRLTMRNLGIQARKWRWA